jgi:hypothetical protein
MKKDLEQERRLTTKRWAKRSKQLDLIIVNTSGMYGELQGLIGKQLKPIPVLEEDETDGAGSTPEVIELAGASEEEE